MYYEYISYVDIDIYNMMSVKVIVTISNFCFRSICSAQNIRVLKNMICVYLVSYNL